MFNYGLLYSRCDYDLFKEGFDRTISRGPDDSRITDTGFGLLGFHRLAIMGLTGEGMQPFSLSRHYSCMSTGRFTASVL